nr:NADH dehydrogenase subunit 2 [Hesionides sp. PA-2020]
MLPSSALFMVTLFSGTLITLSSSQWLFVWSGMELNLLSFIPLITQGSSRQEAEAALKYFLTQAVGSALLLLGALCYKMFLSYNYLSSLLILLSLILKLGAAPFHAWFPQVMSCLSWPLCIMISTWQKIAPISLLFMMLPNPMLIWIGLTSAFIGGLGGLNQSQLRPLLAYSSVGHLGWMLILIFMNQPAATSYLIIYMIMTISLMMLMNLSNLSSRNISAIMNIPMVPAFTISLMLLSLGGMPPFLGFFPKWQAIQLMTSQEMHLTAILMISGALINLFYYLNVSMTTYMSPSLTRSSSHAFPSAFVSMSLGLLSVSPILWSIL